MHRPKLLRVLACAAATVLLASTAPLASTAIAAPASAGAAAAPHLGPGYWRIEHAAGLPAVERDGVRRAGAVLVKFANGTTQVIDARSLGLAPRTWDRFGAAVRVGSVGTDSSDPTGGGPGYDGLVIGVPGTDSGRGAVLVVHGSEKGLGRGVPTERLVRPSGARAFGATMAVQYQPDEDYSRKLMVGAPRTHVGEAKRAGAVYSFDFFDDHLTLAHDATFTQDSPGIQGRAETSDRFGETLTATSSGLVIGTPSEDVGDRKNAGAVTILRYYSLPARTLTLNSKGVPGLASAGDLFGSAAASVTTARSRRYFIGSPGKDLSKAKRAGSVTVIDLSRTRKRPVVVGGRTITQESPGIPGRSRKFDRFGQSLASPNGRATGERLVVGVPGKRVAGFAGAGAVIDMRAAGCRTARPSCARRLTQNSPRVPGTAERRDRFGDTITWSWSPHERKRDRRARYDLFVGVPGETATTPKRLGEIDFVWGRRSDDRPRRWTPPAGVGPSMVWMGLVQQS